MNKLERKCIGLIKKGAEHEIKKTLDNKCLFLCYQPRIPSKLKKSICKNE